RIAVNADPGTVFSGTAPTVKILVQKNTLDTRTGHGYLEGHPDPVPLTDIDRNLCTGFTPILFDDGQVVDVGRDSRLFTYRQKLALAARDGGCLWPDCDRPPSYTEAHHINEWAAQNGLTNIRDGILLCRLHHLLLHNRGWTVTREGTATYWLNPPPSHPDQTPILLTSKTPLNLRSPITPPNTERRTAPRTAGCQIAAHKTHASPNRNAESAGRAGRRATGAERLSPGPAALRRQRPRFTPWTPL
ncbi:MAG: hypothetical protein ABIX44_06935, partial [Cryobacterium sp.]